MLVAVCGCMMKQEGNVPKILKSYRFVDMIFGPQDIFRLPELLYDRVIKSEKVLSVSEDDYLFEDLDSVFLEAKVSCFGADYLWMR